MLEVQIVRNNGSIDFNFEDIKDALASELELYKNLVFTEDTKADAKKTVAELRKLKKQIGDKRIEVKKLYMQPTQISRQRLRNWTSLSMNQLPTSVSRLMHSSRSASRKRESLSMTFTLNLYPAEKI